MSERFIYWKDAHTYAQARANDFQIDQAIRMVKEYGKVGYNVSCASGDDSDYARTEIVTPDKKKRGTK